MQMLGRVSLSTGWVFILVYSLTVSVGIVIGIAISGSYNEHSVAALATQVGAAPHPTLVVHNST